MPDLDYFSDTNKARIIRIILLLFIFAIFPIIISSSSKHHDFNTGVLAASGCTQVLNSTSSTQRVFWVYGKAIPGDTLAACWGQNLTFGSRNECNLVNSLPVYTGTHSIAYPETGQINDYCALSITNSTDPSLDISPYTYLTFYASGRQPGQSYKISILGGANADQIVGSTLKMTNYGGPVPVGNQWFVYNIPISDFHVPSTAIRGIIFQNDTANNQPDVYIDEMAFSSVRGEDIAPQSVLGPPSTPMPTPTRIPDYYPDISPWIFIIPAIIVFIAIIFQ